MKRQEHDPWRKFRGVYVSRPRFSLWKVLVFVSLVAGTGWALSAWPWWIALSGDALFSGVVIIWWRSIEPEEMPPHINRMFWKKKHDDEPWR